MRKNKSKGPVAPANRQVMTNALFTQLRVPPESPSVVDPNVSDTQAPSDDSSTSILTISSIEDLDSLEKRLNEDDN